MERRFLGDGKASYSPVRAAPTAHLVCRACGAIATIDDAALDRRVGELAASLGFVPAERTVSLRGVCAICTADESVDGVARKTGFPRGASRL